MILAVRSRRQRLRVAFILFFSLLLVTGCAATTPRSLTLAFPFTPFRATTMSAAFLKNLPVHRLTGRLAGTGISLSAWMMPTVSFPASSWTG